MGSRLSLVLAIGVALAGAGCGGDDPPAVTTPELPASIERIEETTEWFANAMLDLSVAVKSGNHDVIRGMAADVVDGSPLSLERGVTSDYGLYSKTP